MKGGASVNRRPAFFTSYICGYYMKVSPTFSIDSTNNSPVDSKFRATFDNAAIGVALQTLDEQWIWFNQRLCEIVGFKREELIERNVPGLTHPEDRQRSQDFEQKVRSGALE